MPGNGDARCHRGAEGCKKGFMNLMDWMKSMMSSVPEGKSGNWRVERFSVSEEEEELGRMRALYSFSDRGRFVPAGEYTRLIVSPGGTMMSDTPDELRDHLWPVTESEGTCLVSGLGLGCVVEGMLKKTTSDGRDLVKKVIVLEKSEDVIDLVGGHFMNRYGDRLEIRNVDAFEYKPPKGEKYWLVWHDVWLDICKDNLDEMTKLHRRYARRTILQDSWQRGNLKARRVKRKRDERVWNFNSDRG